MCFNDIVSNVKIYDLEESLKASGYPMRTNLNYTSEINKDVNRGQRLVRATEGGNTAHAQFLTGIRVNFDLTLSIKAWTEAERYRFLEFVSSQSTMHRITKFDLDKAYMPYVNPLIIFIMKKEIKKYQKMLADPFCPPEKTKEQYLKVLYSNPCGFKLTARMTTNYRCLRNIYIQRKDHRLPEWRAFCKWIETLPYFDELIAWQGDNNENN